MSYAILGATATSQRAFPRCDGISNFRAVIRKLWTDHMLWMRQYIISTLANSPDKDAALQRLLANQDAIARSVITFLGPVNSLKLAKLLREHIAIAGKVLVAAQAEDAHNVGAAQKEWLMNVVAIATLLNKANPRWPQKTLFTMLQQHLDFTAKEVTARLAGNWTGDIAAFDAGFDHMLKFADFLANGMLGMLQSAVGRKR